MKFEFLMNYSITVMILILFGNCNNFLKFQHGSKSLTCSSNIIIKYFIKYSELIC